MTNDYHHVVRGCNSSAAQLYFNSMNSTIDTTVLVGNEDKDNVTEKTSITRNFALDDIMMQTTSNQAIAVSSTINKQDIIDPPQLQHNQQNTYEYQDFRLLGDQRQQHHHHHHHHQHQQQYIHHHHQQHQHHDHTMTYQQDNPNFNISDHDDDEINSPNKLLLPANTFYSSNDKHQRYKTITTINVPTFYYPQQFVTIFRTIHMPNNYDSQQHYHHHQHNRQINHDYRNSSLSSLVDNHHLNHQDHSKK
jgi:hypothetical protein